MNIDKFTDFVLKINEDTSATGGPVVSSGMGAVVSAQPSGLAGTTIGPNWASGGGTEGSGDISIPYNPSGSARVFQKIPVMGKSHGSRTGKKSREKKIDLKALKDIFAKRKDYTYNQDKGKKVLDYQDFIKYDFNKVKK
jgi:hypothetical protein